MAGKSASITINILGDADSAKKAINETEGAFKGFGSKMSGFAAGAGAAIGTFAIDAGKSLLSAAGGWIETAKQAEIFGKKADVVFGDSADAVKKWADGVNESMGLSDETVVGLAASMGDLLVPLGFSRDAAAGMSQQMIELSGALSAWSGGTIGAAEVSDIMTKAMLGETDGLKALGISISAEEVARKAATMAAEGQTFATEQQANAAATQALILEKSTDAQTAWADGTMDAVKQQNEATAAWEDAKVALGDVLLPIVQNVTKWFVAEFIPAARKVASTFSEHVGPIIESVWEGINAAFQWVMDHKPVLIGAITAIGVGLGVMFATWAAGAIAAAAATIAATAPIIAIAAAIGALVAGVIYAYQHWEAFRVAVDAVATFLTQTLWPGLQAVFQWIATTIPPILQGIVDAISGAIDVIRGVWEQFGGYITAYVGAVFEAVRAVIDGAMQVIRGVIETVMALITGDWSGAWEGVQKIVDGVWIAISGLISAAIHGIQAALGLAWEAIKGAASLAWEGIKSVISSAIDAVVGFVTGLPGRLGAIASGLFSDVTNAATTAWDGIKSTVSGAIDEVVTAVTGLPGRLLELVGSITDAGADIGQAILTGIGQGIKGTVGFFGDLGAAAVDAMKEAANDVIDAINDALEFKINGPGPLPDIHLDPPDLPHFHGGGVVPGPIGTEVLAVLQAGETVRTTDQEAALGRFPSHITVQIGEHEFEAVLIAHDNETVTRARQGRR